MIETTIAFIFNQYGLFGAIGLIILILLMKDYKTTWTRIKHLMRLMIGSNSIDSYDVLISKLKYWIDFKIENLYLQDPGRKAIFKDLIKIRFTVFLEHIKAFNSAEIKNMNAGELYSLVVACIHDSIETWEINSKASGIPVIVIEKYKKHSSKNVEFMLKAVEMVCYSAVYGDNTKRMQVIYSLYTAMFEVATAEGERSFNEINGELAGINYNGYVCCG